MTMRLDPGRRGGLRIASDDTDTTFIRPASLSITKELNRNPNRTMSIARHSNGKRKRLRLVAAAGAATASLLELAPLVAHVRLGVGAGHTGRAEVLDRLARELGTAEKRHALARGRLERELIKGEALAARLQDPSPGRLGEAQGAHAELGHFEHARVVGDGTDDRGDAAGGAVLRELGQRERGSVRLGHEQPLQDRLVRFGIRAADEEPVQLDEELEVHVLGLGRGARLLLVAPAGLDIDPLLVSGWVERMDVVSE